MRIRTYCYSILRNNAVQPCSQELQHVGQQLLPRINAFTGTRYYLSPTNATAQACSMHPLRAANRLPQFFGFCRSFELGKRSAGQRRYRKEGILGAVACACFLLNLLLPRRIKPIVMGASFPNPTVYEPLAVESLPRPLFFLLAFFSVSCPSREAGMREEFLYGLIIDLINSRYALHLCLNCSSSSAIVSSSRELGSFRRLTDCCASRRVGCLLADVGSHSVSVDGNS